MVACGAPGDGDETTVSWAFETSTARPARPRRIRRASTLSPVSLDACATGSGVTFASLRTKQVVNADDAAGCGLSRAGVDDGQARCTLWRYAATRASTDDPATGGLDERLVRPGSPAPATSPPDASCSPPRPAPATPRPRPTRSYCRKGNASYPATVPRELRRSAQPVVSWAVPVRRADAGLASASTGNGTDQLAGICSCRARSSPSRTSSPSRRARPDSPEGGLRRTNEVVHGHARPIPRACARCASRSTASSRVNEGYACDFRLAAPMRRRALAGRSTWSVSPTAATP